MNNEEKILALLEKMDSRQNKTEALLEKMQGDISAMQSGISVMQGDIISIKNRLDAVEESQEVMRASQLKVELEQYPKISAALDGFFANRDKNDQHGERIAFLEKKTDIHDVRIGALELKVK